MPLTCTLREQKEHAHTSNSTLFRPPRGRDEGRRGRTEGDGETDRTSQQLKSGIYNIEARNVANKSTPLWRSLKDLGVHPRHDPHHRSNDRLCEETDRTCTCTPGASTHTGGGRRSGALHLFAFPRTSRPPPSSSLPPSLRLSPYFLCLSLAVFPFFLPRPLFRTSRM